MKIYTFEHGAIREELNGQQIKDYEKVLGNLISVTEGRKKVLCDYSNREKGECDDPEDT